MIRRLLCWLGLHNVRWCSRCADLMRLDSKFCKACNRCEKAKK